VTFPADSEEGQREGDGGIKNGYRRIIHGKGEAEI
jgi:hypothetical protein